MFVVREEYRIRGRGNRAFETRSVSNRQNRLIRVNPTHVSFTSHGRARARARMTDFKHPRALPGGFDNKIEEEVRKKNSYLERPIPITVITRRPE